jgi:hypothetical protein
MTTRNILLFAFLHSTPLMSSYILYIRAIHYSKKSTKQAMLAFRSKWAERCSHFLDCLSFFDSRYDKFSLFCNFIQPECMHVCQLTSLTPSLPHSLTHCQLTWLKVEGILQLIWKMERTQSFLPILSNTARVASSLASLTHSHTPSLRAARLSNTARVASSLASLTHSLTPSLRTVRCCRTLLGWRHP